MAWLKPFVDEAARTQRWQRGVGGANVYVMRAGGQEDRQSDR